LELFKIFGVISMKDEASDPMDKTEKKGKSLASALGGIAKGAAVAGGAIIAGGAAMLKMATDAAATTDRIDKMSQKIGMSRKAFQEWDFVASQSGTQVEALQGGFKTFTAMVTEANEGTERAVEAFDKLKISVEDGNGNLRTQEDLFEEAVNKLQLMEDGTEKARLATELFGRAGSELMPLLNGAAGSVEEMKAKAHELGLVMGDEAIDAGVQFTDTMDQLKRSFGAAVATIGVEFMPAIQSMGEWITSNMPTIQAVVRAVFDVIKFGIDIVKVAFENQMLPVLEAFYNFFVENILPILQTFYDWFMTKLPELQEMNKKTTDFILMIWGMVGEFLVKEFIPAAMQVWAFIEKNLLPIFKELGNWIMKHMPEIKAVTETAFKVIIFILKAAWEGFKALVAVIGEVLEIAIPIIVEIGRAIGEVMEKIANDIQSVIDFFAKLIGWAENAINAVKNFFKAQSEGGSLSDSQFTITGRAAGGTFGAGDVMRVGESGPELVAFGSSGTVIPNSDIGGNTYVDNRTFNVYDGTKGVRRELNRMGNAIPTRR
jgi:hypothetical protein